MTIEQLERETLDLSTRGDTVGDFLWDACEELLSAGVPRDVLIARLQDLYSRLGESGHKDARDEVVDVLNALSGYASPSARL